MPFCHFYTGRRNSILVLVALASTSIAASPVLAQSKAIQQSNPEGHVEFDFPNAPAATVEVDVNQDMLSAVTGIGQAAISGVAEALLDSADGNASAPIQESAAHLQAVNQIVTALSGVVQEVRVRVYEDLSELAPGSHEMISHYHRKLQGSSWSNVVRVRDANDSVTISVLQQGDAIRGLFVVVSEDNELVLVNIVCDLAPDRVKQVANEGTRIGMKFGLEKVIRQATQEIERELH